MRHEVVPPRLRLVGLPGRVRRAAWLGLAPASRRNLSVADNGLAIAIALPLPLALAGDGRTGRPTHNQARDFHRASRRKLHHAPALHLQRRANLSHHGLADPCRACKGRDDRGFFGLLRPGTVRDRVRVAQLDLGADDQADLT